MKLGLYKTRETKLDKRNKTTVTKLDKRNKTTLKQFGDDVMSKNCDVIVIFLKLFVVFCLFVVAVVFCSSMVMCC